MNLVSVLVVAFLGGLVLNVMPCVLPVLTLKVYRVVNDAHAGAKVWRTQALAYAAGTISAFAAFATVAVVARLVLGKGLLWGSPFQLPRFVAALTLLVFVFALNALGVFEINVSSSDSGEREGVWGSVFNGWFAALMATPCSAPFLGSATAAALAIDAPAWLTFALFMMIGAGLAAPFVVIAFVPFLAHALPKPGAWMESFKQLLGFTLLATAIWLYGVLLRQLTAQSATWFLGFLLLVAIALWGAQRFGGVQFSAARRYSVRAVALALVVVAGVKMTSFERPGPTINADSASGLAGNDEVVRGGHINWASFDSTRIKREHARNRPVFVDYTADWCASCQTNDKVFIETDPVRDTLKKTGVLPMKADLTNESEEISASLEKLGRNGIPAYVVFYPDGSRDLLPVAITTDMVVKSLEAASKKYPPSGFGS